MNAMPDVCDVGKILIDVVWADPPAHNELLRSLLQKNEKFKTCVLLLAVRCFFLFGDSACCFGERR